DQVKVLPYFTITEFFSQNHTRNCNVCHLSHCRGYQSVHTCLFHGSSLKGTVIIAQFDVNKI
ncbi:uncharacterized protein LAESUDRAFT_665212, partial [Laetiporus sulphureus 93-53]